MAVHSSSRTRSRAHRWHAPSNEPNNEFVPISSRTAVEPVRPLALQAQSLELLLIAGLAGVFMVNALVAVIEPSDFTGLVERSLVGRLVPTMSGGWIAWVIAVHDFTIGVSLLATVWIARARPFVLAWAGIWLLIVALVKLTSLEAFGG